MKAFFISAKITFNTCLNIKAVIGIWKSFVNKCARYWMYMFTMC